MARLQTEIEEAIRGLTSEQLSRQVEGKWSVAPQMPRAPVLNLHRNGQGTPSLPSGRPPSSYFSHALSPFRQFRGYATRIHARRTHRTPASDPERRSLLKSWLWKLARRLRHG